MFNSMAAWWDTVDYYLISTGVDVAIKYREDTISDQLLTFVWLGLNQPVENL